MPAVVIRRNKLARTLLALINLAQNQLDGKPFEVMKYRSVKDSATGLRKQIEAPKRIKPRWFQIKPGKLCVGLKYGSCTIGLAKGKPSVKVTNAEELVKALTAFKAAVKAGKLHAQIEQASSGLKQRFCK